MKNLLGARHSARAFSSQPVTNEIITKVIAEAQLAPSWENTQPYHVYVASKTSATKIREEHRAKVKAGEKSWADFQPSQEQNFNSSALNNMKRFNQSINNLGADGKQKFWNLNAQPFNAPVLVYITVPKNATAYEHYDAGALGYGILLAAQHNGLKGILAYEIIRYAADIHNHFDISEDERILMGIGLGYPDTQKINQFNPGRENVNNVLTIKS